MFGCFIYYVTLVMTSSAIDHIRRLLFCFKKNRNRQLFVGETGLKSILTSPLEKPHWGNKCLLITFEQGGKTNNNGSNMSHQFESCDMQNELLWHSLTFKLSSAETDRDRDRQTQTRILLASLWMTNQIVIMDYSACNSCTNQMIMEREEGVVIDI